jgi:DNA-binding protein Fis
VAQGTSTREGKAGLPLHFTDGDGRMRPLPEVRKIAAAEVEREYLEAVMTAAKDNLSHAADLAGIARQSLTELLKKHGLHRLRFERKA